MQPVTAGGQAAQAIHAGVIGVGGKFAAAASGVNAACPHAGVGNGRPGGVDDLSLDGGAPRESDREIGLSRRHDR